MDSYLAEIRLFAGTYAPKQWHFCDGQILSINQYQALYSLLGTTYGGDGRTTFALPDLRGRVPVSQGTNPTGSSYSLGSKSGEEIVTLQVTQIPPHNHVSTVTNTINLNVQVNDNDSDSEDPTDRFFGHNANSGNNYSSVLGSTDATLNTGAITGDANTSVTINGAGGGQPHENRQPLIAINYIICVEGQFPSRN